MLRPPWSEYFLKMAFHAATRATCDRKHVGAILVYNRRVVSTGYNGAPSGMPDCDEAGHDLVDDHCVRSLHAESNAIDFAGRGAGGCTLYITVTPCYDCAKRIVSAGIVKVVYADYYASRYNKSKTVPEYLRSGNVEVEEYSSPGLTLWRRKQDELVVIEREIAHATTIGFQCGCVEPGDTARLYCSTHPTSQRLTSDD